MKKQRITIRDVAKTAGVSLGTASRALNRTGRVSADAILAVAKAARQLGYEPDAVAQSMRTRSTGSVGILVSDFSNPLYAHIIMAVESAMQAAGYSLLLANTHNNAKRERALIDLFRRRRVDGLILGPCAEESPKLLEQLASDLPVVGLDRDLHESGSGVHVDHFHGALQATRYLLDLGHTDIALLTPGSSLRPGRERIAGFTDAFRMRGLEPVADLIRSERSAMNFAFSEALALLSSSKSPTAFLCLSTRILTGVLEALRHSGRSVPDDVSVIGIGDTDLSRLFSPPLTTLTWDLEAVGASAAELLLKQLDQQQGDKASRLLITTQLLLRDSCAPAPKGRGRRAATQAVSLPSTNG